MVRATPSKDGQPRFTVRVEFRCHPQDLVAAAADIVVERHGKGRGTIEFLSAEVGARAIVERIRRNLWLSGMDWATGEDETYEEALVAVEGRVRQLFPDVFPRSGDAGAAGEDRQSDQ